MQTNTQDIRQFISALLTTRINLNRFNNNTPGLGIISENSQKKAFLSPGTGLRRNSSQLLSQLSPNYAEEIKAQLSPDTNKKSGILLNDQMREYIKSFEENPARHELLINEFQKRAPFISQKLDKAIGNAPQRDNMEIAKQTLDAEIKKCRLIVATKVEKDSRILDALQNQKIDYKGHEVEATVNGKGTGISITVYEAQNLDIAHQNMQSHYIDMSKVHMDNLGTAVNMGTITPTALMEFLIGQTTKNDYTLASRIGITSQLKNLSISRFNQDHTGVEKITTEIKDKLTNYLNVINGRTLQTGQTRNIDISQQQGMSIGV